jgi:hypothetical protein
MDKKREEYEEVKSGGHSGHRRSIEEHLNRKSI